MSGWFQANIVQTGRLPLFCFFVAFISGFGFIRLSVRMIRAKVRWWPGNVTSGDMHIHHMVFGVVLMVVAGVGGLAAPLHPIAWRAVAAGLFGLGTALVLDEFALILHLRDVYWTSAGRLSVDAVFVAAGFTALLLLGFTPVGVQSVDSRLDVPTTGGRFVDFVITVAVVFVLATITLLKGKFWTALFGVFVPLLFIVGAIRLARPGSPWARWRYAARPRKQVRAGHREQRLREPVNRLKARFQDLLAGDLSRLAEPREPAEPPDARPARRHSSSR